MASCRSSNIRLLRSFHPLHPRPAQSNQSSTRLFHSSYEQQDEQLAETPPRPSFRRNPDPNLVSSRRLEKKLVGANNPPIGSRRRRQALQDAPGIPFEQLPYQCFQEARNILQADRAEKLKKIEAERARYLRLRELSPADAAGKNRRKQQMDASMRTIERLKILADINDPLVKRRFEDGLGDMNKPIYRYLADKKWRQHQRLVLMQRLTQMKVVPDLLPNIDPITDVRLAFVSPKAFSQRGLEDGDFSQGVRSGDLKWVPPGEFVDSKISEKPCWLRVQSFERGEKLVSVAIVDPDVPNLEKDGFDYRCHFLASNIPISPTQRSINLATLSPTDQILLPWIPPHAQKGSPYHRLAIFVLHHPNNTPIKLDTVSQHVQAKDFILRGFVDRHRLKPIGAHLFRTKWDETMAEVMQRAGLEGADMELKRTRVEPLPYKRRNPSSMR